MAQLNVISDWVLDTTRSTKDCLSLQDGALDPRLSGMPVGHRNLIARLKDATRLLPRGDSQRFARCVLLKTAQWAFDGKEKLPSSVEFVSRFRSSFEEMREGMEAYTSELAQQGISNAEARKRRILSCGPAANVALIFKRNPDLRRAGLVVTSPPYLGVHVLYHRWQLQGRRELQAPFYIADCEDLGGASKYTIVGRHDKSSEVYFRSIESSFRSVSDASASGAYVIQLVSFSDPAQALPKYLDALNSAGLQLCETYIHTAGQLSWRSVPGRRWYARVGAVSETSASQEVLLVHRKERR
jgi:hypothetical protein